MFAPELRAWTRWAAAARACIRCRSAWCTTIPSFSLSRASARSILAQSSLPRQFSRTSLGESMTDTLDKAKVIAELKEATPEAYKFNTRHASLLGRKETDIKVGDDFLKRLIDNRTDETGRMWVKIGAGLAILGVIGSIGTFARIARKSFSSGIPNNALTLWKAAPTSMSTVAFAEKQAQAVILKERIEELKKRLKERHPLWYPGDGMP